MKHFKPYLLLLFLLLTILPQNAFAQGDLAATLEVLSEGVEVKRVNTEQWIAVQVEAIVGVGDQIRTGEKGRARIIFFADGTETELLANTTYQIDQFTGNEEGFQLSVSVLGGQTIQRLNRLLDTNSSYDVNTPGMELAARGTNFRIRVEADGRSAMLVDEGLVQAGAESEVPPGFGVRAEEGGSLSEVVPASDFATLDSALDGCTAELSLPDDSQFNIRLAPDRDAPRIGSINPAEVTTLFGRTQGGNWYRIAYRGGFGWILASQAEIGTGCAGLRPFPDDFPGEDPASYDSLGEDISLDELPTPTPTPDTNEG
jgi:hypothetical protein